MANETTNINLKDLLFPWQKEVFKEIDKKKYSVLVIARRSGKTILAVIYLIYRALKKPNRDYAYMWPYTNQVKEIAWEYLKKFASQIPWTEVNNTELRVKFSNWSRIRLFWADNPDSLRGLNISGAILDEYSQINTKLFDEILFPMINFFEDGFAIFVWTPMWFDAFHDVYKKAKKNNKRYAVLKDVYQAKVLSEDKIEEAIEIMDPIKFQQEMMCNFNVAIQGSYYWKYIAELREEGRLVPDLYSPELPVFTYWDIGMDDATTILFTQYHNWEVRVVDYLEDRQRGLDYYVEMLRNKWYSYHTHTLPHDWKVKEWWTWMTRFEQFQTLIWNELWEVIVGKRFPVEDWIQAVRKMLPYTIVDESLDLHLSRLSQYEANFDPKKWIFWKPKHDEFSHIADSFRYCAMEFENNSAPEVEYEEPFTQNYDDMFTTSSSSIWDSY